MPLKRSRRSSSISDESVSITDYNEDSIQSAASTISTRKRRKTIDSRLEIIHCQEILDKLRNAKAEDGHLIADAFIRLPNKRTASDYYDVIEMPIDIIKIQSRIKNDEYETFFDFQIDIEQLVENAKTYHSASSLEYQDAMLLWNAFEQEKRNIAIKADIKAESNTEGRFRRNRKRIAISVDDGMSDQISLSTSDDSRNTSEISSNFSENPLDAYFTAIVAQRTEEGKDLAPTFTFLPSKNEYPQYFDIIKEPVDLRMIAKRIKSGVYLSIDDIERDFQLMIKNAKVFNKQKSDAFQDAVELEKIIKIKRSEIETGIKIQKPKRGRRRKTPLNLTDKYAKLESPKDSDEFDSEEPEDNLESTVEIDEDLNILVSDNRYHQWQLYKAITSITLNNGNNLAAPFMKLPSKKIYPDYYLEIMEPVSLLMVKAKIKKNMYQDLDQTLNDMDLVFNNAQQFNVEDSAIYKESVRLQNLAHMKKEELINSSQDDYMDELLPLIPQSLPAILPEIFKYSNENATNKRQNSFTKMNNATATSTPRKTRPPMTPDELKLKRINNLFQAIYSYQEDNRYLRDIFMNLPSREQYPDYYKVIPDPIDLGMIRKKIDEKKYDSHTDLVEDLKLMFSNAKHYNEQSSQVFKDAVTLEKIMKKKTKNIAAANSSSSRGSRKNETSTSIPVGSMSPVFTIPINQNTQQFRIREIFQTVKDYHDINGRSLAEPFIKLPSKQDMPEYYEFIRKPIELQTIQYRINNDRYHTVEDIMSELVLMFTNACTFNEPDSQIYRDALVLLRVALEKNTYLSKDDDLSDPPNVQDVTHEIMLTLFSQFYNYVDEDGRFLVESLSELEGELVTRKSIGENACNNVDLQMETCRLNLEKIKNDLHKRRYKRMDRLQEDVFSFLKYARNVSPLNSQIYEDACEMQKIFITLRDVHCKRGEILLTPALNYIERYLHQDIEMENKERKQQETINEDDHDNNFLEQMKKDNNYRMLDSVNRQDNNFEIGEFVKIQCNEIPIYNVGEIIAIIVPNSDGIQTDDLHSDGCLIRLKRYFYPRETKPKAPRRFIENEVFQTTVYETISLNQIVGKCLVLHVKDYIKYFFKKFKDSDIYVCESKYSVNDCQFKKLKTLQYKSNIKDRFVSREEPLILNRSFLNCGPSITKIEKTDFLFTLENTKENVLQEDRTGIDCCVYYDQYVCENGFNVKVGDYVYVKDSTNNVQIVRIDQLWKNMIQNIVYFSGPWFIQAMNVEHMPTKVFYRKEVFLSSLDGARHLLTSIIGKCVILSFSDYCKYRPTEYLEENMYICEFKYFVEDKVARKLKKGLKKAQLSTKALDDEIYFFKRELVPIREASPLLNKCSTELIRQEYITRMNCLSQLPLSSATNPAPSIMSDDTQCNVSVSSSGNRRSGRRSGKKIKLRKPPSGYVVYAGEVRKKLMLERPETTFGDLSKEVGEMWRNMPQVDKDVYERKALEIKYAMQKENALKKDMSIENKNNLPQQQQQQNVTQQVYVGGSPQNQRNFIQIPPTGQPLVPSAATQNQNAPIHYFQTSNGQVLQFISSPNVQQGGGSGSAIQFTTSSGSDQQLQMIQQPNQPAQQVIYQISQNQNGQQIINNQAQFQNTQYLMSQNKVTPFQPQQLPNTQVQMQNIPGLPQIHQISQNQTFPNFNPSINPTSITSQSAHYNFTPTQPVPEVSHVPMNFVSVPPRSARVFHSEIYQKYIEKLRKNSAYISDWKQQLEFSKEAILNAQGNNKQAYINKLCQEVAPQFLDSKLLMDGKDKKKLTQEAIVDSLFKLRDHMLHDAMNIRTKILGLEEL